MHSLGPDAEPVVTYCGLLASNAGIVSGRSGIGPIRDLFPAVQACRLCTAFRRSVDTPA